MAKRVYSFGGGSAEGSAEMKNLLGGKGAGLAEMSNIGVPVPAGFTITTEVCTEYYKNNRQFPDGLAKEVEAALKKVEKIMGAVFGDPENPLLVSVRSGARVSMPGMMDTVLNLGLNDETIKGIIKKTGNERFAWDSYRRFIQMYGDIVMGLKPQGKDEIDPFEAEIEKIKHSKGYKSDLELNVDDLKELVKRFKALIKSKLKKDFPTDPQEQLWGAIGAVFGSWNNERAILYRKLNGFDDSWGTAVTVQSMVFGNMGDKCATGVAFTRDPSTGEKTFFGEYLVNAQGEDVVAGIRTPQQITIKGSQKWAKENGISEKERKEKYPSLEEYMPKAYQQLVDVYMKLEKHYRDMQDIEFTIQNEQLWMLQTRTGKRTALAAVNIAVDMVNEKLIDKKEAVLRVEPASLDQLLHPTFDPKAKKQVIAKGLPASPGAATGKVVFNADDAAEWTERGEKVILVRIETSPEDLKGMNAAQGILTARGGMTSHAAVVARGMGKCCVSGCGALEISYPSRSMKVGDIVVKEGDYISIDGSTGDVMLGKVNTVEPKLTGNFETIMKWADEFRRLKIRTNADTPKDAKVARDFGAEGIGLCRTEHMFFEGDRIKAVREMILADTLEERKKALKKLLPMQKKDFLGIFKAMEGLGVTIRLLDPPLHEFVPQDEESQKEMAKEMGKSLEEVKAKVNALHEFNPMLGHRGCRLGITYPEITEMQAQAIFEAACELKAKGVDVKPEVMVPLVGTVKELQMQKKIIVDTAEKVMAQKKVKLDYLVGTMIEVPRAALTADEIAKEADFFSFGTNDLTQMTFGYSRDDSGSFLPEYVDKKILPNDPFRVLDREGVGQLVKMSVEKGKSTNKNLKLGICGEHGGDPSSIEFCHLVGLDYVSCSPFRVPIARLAAAHAAIKNDKKK
ncbi:MAG: Pyruvate, phosphate dikinase [Spirochaetes bacterium ADurb.Bin218]|jgi:pyruvate,orthophosphate dikinase|nr:pyruvate, phosphate dikinase [Spirochaetota bacterium]OQA96046.1 MAG: Pyruvate, phosphate dikinase [Spirochaetes bacterium ADurb.Bin218]HOQ11276.1 pyruvate, phosphate dikinase [Spirochaetota bacterium]HOV07564.1 pyruvate, phosphate dikinase [Spirochaetota bacterium]HPX91232.1 pyruvate, phosphate dikinase [Spirochaetota bacterium]